MKKMLTIIIIFVIVFGFLYNNEIHRPVNKNIGEKEFVIENGQGVNAIADKLKTEGFLKNELWFKAYIFLSGKRAGFHDGTYKIDGNKNIIDLVVALQSKKEIKNEEVAITLVEGWNVADMDEYLFKQGLIVKDNLNNYSQSYLHDNWPFLKDVSEKASLEGFLFPDTYRVYKSASVINIVEKMLENFDDKITPELRDEIKKQGKSIYEILTMASIVEKEMHGYQNRQKVAGIFWKRIKEGYPLQSDATVNYITKKGTVRPTREDTELDNRYNTYKYFGLPPGPICNPGIEAIKAAIYPEKTPYYFFLTTPSAEIIFSKTYEEHLKNTYKYLE